jgi:hypothetical protein
MTQALAQLQNIASRRIQCTRIAELTDDVLYQCFGILLTVDVNVMRIIYVI